MNKKFPCDRFLSHGNVAPKNKKTLDKNTIMTALNNNECYHCHTIFSRKSCVERHLKKNCKIVKELNKKLQENKILTEKMECTYKNFFEENLMSIYDHKRVLYIGFIGVYKGEEIFKYGRTFGVFKRAMIDHIKTYNIFKIVEIFECLNYEVIEKLFGKEMMVLDTHRKIKINGRLRTELFTTTKEIGLTKIREKMCELIKYFPINKDKELADSEYKLLQEENIAKEIENKRLQGDNTAKELEIQYIKLKQEENIAKEVEHKRLQEENIAKEVEHKRLQEENIEKELEIQYIKIKQEDNIAKEVEYKRLQEENRAKEAEYNYKLMQEKNRVKEAEYNYKLIQEKNRAKELEIQSIKLKHGNITDTTKHLI
jgi:hypothetical protein